MRDWLSMMNRQVRPPVDTTVAARRRITPKSAILLGIHAAIFATVYWISFLVRYDFTVESRWLAVYGPTVFLLLAAKTSIFYALGQCHSPWRHTSFSDLTRLVWAATISMLLVWFADGLLASPALHLGIPRIPRSVLVLDWAVTVLAIGGIRALWRFIRQEVQPLLTGLPIRSVLIVGADEHGEMLARNLAAASSTQYSVVGFLDDDPGLQHHRVGGVPVLGGIDRVADEVRRRRIDDVMVRSGALPGARFRKLMAECSESGADVKVIPAIDELLDSGDHRSVFQPRAVEIRDLLRREPVVLDDAAVARLIEGKTVLVTGAGGSIGSELCRQVLRYEPKALLLVERAENSLFLLEQEFARLDPRPRFEAIVADVADETRMSHVIAAHRPDVIFHAAAHKHVPMMESNPVEAIKNNCLGTQCMARLADRHGVRVFVMISTDKAVNPTSVMGCSKLVAERFVQALNAESETKFMVVRFGNVLASNGSVVPIFQEQIRRGGPITVTHPGIARYFMLIPEASQLVLQAAAMGGGGEIFVLDMGESIKIVDLARDMIALSGFTEDQIEIVFTGLRPGEKLYEELYFDDEHRLATNHPKVFCAQHRPTTLAEAEALIDDLAELVDEPAEVVRSRMRAIVPEYGSHCGADEIPALPRKTHAK